MNLPTGTITFVFTDIEGSTRLWEEQHDAMLVALARHNALLSGAITTAGGHVFKTAGDACYAAFARAEDALAACREAQRALLSEPWPEGMRIRTRMAAHTGRAGLDHEAGDYYGPTLNRVARLRDAGHGGQILLSNVSHDLCRHALPAGCTFKPLGPHRLKDLGRPEAVFQLCHPDLPIDFPPLRSLSTHPNNLPKQLTSFIGREREVKEVRALFPRARLVTLTGTGGTGKTRLALQIAAEVLEQYPDGVWLVDLAGLSDPALVPSTVATALGVKESAGKPILQTMANRLKSKKLLIVLDNCEHLLESCADLAGTLLNGSPNLLILATSREAMGIRGEFTYQVPSLSLPNPKNDTTPELLSRFESIRLFIDRAQFHQPEFEITSHNAPVLASVCHRLDGIPLAIELAAARIRSLSVEEVDQRLDQRFRLLTGGYRTAMPRQQTLRSLIDWSYDLLNDSEKALLCRLSVFSGGWSLDAVEAIASTRVESLESRVESPVLAADHHESQHGPLFSTLDSRLSTPSVPLSTLDSRLSTHEVLDLLTSLIDKSMVVAEPRETDTRYRLLETVRQYAWERLVEMGEGELWRGRHLAYFAEMGEEASPNLAGEEQQTWLEWLEGEHDNLRAALKWAEGHQPEVGLRLAGAVWRFWYVRGYFEEGRERLEALLKAVGPNGSQVGRARALTGIGVMAYCKGEYADSRAIFEKGLAINRALGDRPGIATLLNNLGNVAYDQAEYSRARTLFEESLAIRRELGDRRGTAATLNNLGNVTNELGDYAAARVLFEESLALKMQLGDQWGVAISLSNLGLTAFNGGDYAEARSFFERSLEIRRELGDRGGIAISLHNLGNVVQIQGDDDAARALFRESLEIKHELGDRWGIASSLEALASVAGADRALFAAWLWGAAERLREEIRAPLPFGDRERYDKRVAKAWGAADNAVAFEASWLAGRESLLDVVVGLALAG